MPPRPRSSDTARLVQTSIRLPHDLLKRARIRAATDEISFQALLIGALDAELARREQAEARRQARREGRRPAASG